VRPIGLTWATSLPGGAVYNPGHGAHHLEIHNPAGLGFCRGRLSLDGFLLGGGVLLRQQGLIALGRHPRRFPAPAC
jgi:hypothetical protein